MQTVTRELTFTYDNAETYLTGDDIDLAYKVGSSKYVFRSSAKEGYATLNDAAKDVLFPTATAKIASVESTFTEAHASTTNDNHKLQFQYAASDSSTFAVAHTQTLSTSDYTGSVTSTALAGYTRDNAYRYYLVINSTLASARCTSTTLKFNFNQYECAANNSDTGITNVSVSNPSPYEGDETVFTATMAAGYEFDGWYSDPECTTLVSPLNPFPVIATKDLTLYTKSITNVRRFELRITVDNAADYLDDTDASRDYDYGYIYSANADNASGRSGKLTDAAKAVLYPNSTAKPFKGAVSCTVSPVGSNANFQYIYAQVSVGPYNNSYADVLYHMFDSESYGASSWYTHTYLTDDSRDDAYFSVYVKGAYNPRHGIKTLNFCLCFRQFACAANAVGTGISTVHVSDPEPYEGDSVTFTANLLPDATWEGWYSDEACTQQVSTDMEYTTDAADLTLYAKATAAVPSYTVSAIASDNVTSASASANSVSSGDDVTFTAVVDSGAVFAGWYDSTNNLISNQNPYTTTVTGDLTLYAKATMMYSCYAVAKDNITSATASAQSVESGSNVTFAAVVAANCTFDGWFSTSDCAASNLVSQQNPYTTAITSNTTLYAKATANPAVYTCSAVAKDNITSATVDPSSVTEDSTAIFTAVVSSGASFSGWYSDVGCTQLVSNNNPYTATITDNLTLYAKATIAAAPTTYTCNAVAKDNVTSASASVSTITEGGSVTFTATLSSGATFSGWYSNEACTNLVSTQNPYTTTISSNTTLYAKATVATVTKYTCSAVAKDNITSATVNSTSVDAGSNVTFTATANSNSTFTGWYSDPGCVILVSSENPYTTTVTSDITLYAKGTVIVINYSCSAVAGTGVASALVSSSTVSEGSKCTYTATMNSGYSFSGWYSDASYSSLVSTSNPYTVTINADTTLYAKGRRAEISDDNTYNVRIKHKRDTSANWTTQNPVLLDGEIIVVNTDNGTRTKTGDGDKRYSQLPFDDEILRNLIAARVLLDQGTAASGKILSVGTDGIVGVRTLRCEGGVSASITDDKITISHDASGVTEGTYGSTSNQTPSFGGTATVPTFAVTSAGHLTSAGNRTITIPSATATTSAAGLMSASDKTKLNGIEDGANKTTIDSALSSTSTNPVQNNVINTAIESVKTDLKNNYLSDTGDTMYGTLTFSTNGKIVLGSSLYGTSLPSSGTTGQIFFKKA